MKNENTNTNIIERSGQDQKTPAILIVLYCCCIGIICGLFAFGGSSANGQILDGAHFESENPDYCGLSGQECFELIRFQTPGVDPLPAVTGSAITFRAGQDSQGKFEAGNGQNYKFPTEKLADGTDLDRLAYAVAMAETADCNRGIGKSKNNCFGIMAWPKGKRTGKTYKSKEESYADFKRIWKKSYKIYPTPFLARKWTGNDNPSLWLKTVNQYY